MLRRSRGATKIDFRITWIGKVVERLLSIADHSVYENFLKEDEGRNDKQLRQFCDGLVQDGPAASKHLAGPSHREAPPPQPVKECVPCPRFPFISFWTTTQEVEVEEEIVRASTYVADTEATDESEEGEGPNYMELEAPGSSPITKDVSAEPSPLNLSKEGEAVPSSASQASPAGSTASVDDDRPESSGSTIDAEIQKITMKKRIFRIVLHVEVGPSRKPAALSDDADDGRRLYLIRTTRGLIPIPDLEEAAFREMGRHFEVEFADGSDAESFTDLLDKVYFPLLKMELQSKPFTDRRDGVVHLQQIVNRPHLPLLAMQQFLRDMEEYCGFLSLYHAQASKPFFIVSDDLRDVELEDLTMPHFTERLEVVCRQWTKDIERTVADWQTRLQMCATPLEEVAFWSDAERSLGDVRNGLRDEQVQAILRALWTSGNACVDNFSFHKDELEHFFQQSREAARYMNILKQSFMVLEKEPLFAVIRRTISEVVPTLRLVWSATKYYNVAERMAPLMQRIANQLADRIIDKIHVEYLLSSDQRSTYKAETREGQLLLEEWKQSYLDVRALSDSTGQVPPWEFDRKKLFERTDYLASVCHNVVEAFEVLEQLEHTHIAEMDAAFHETEHFDRLRTKMDEMPGRVFRLTFNPLDLGNGTSWKYTMEHFKREVELIDAEFVQLLDDGFGHLRSARAAAELLLALDAADCRPLVKRHVRKKVNVMAEKLLAEIDDVRQRFERCANDCSLFKNLPPVASSVFWSRRLLQQVEASVCAFRAVPQSAEETTFNELINSKHTALAAAIVEFGNARFQSWVASQVPLIKTLLQEPLLRKDHLNQTDSAFDYKVNFPLELVTMIAEAKHLENLGYVVPLKIRLVALQEPMFVRQIFLLKSVVAKGQRWSVQPNVEQDQNYQEYRRQLDRGCTKLNWMPLSVDAFLEHCLVSPLEKAPLSD